MGNSDGSFGTTSGEYLAIGNRPDVAARLSRFGDELLTLVGSESVF